MVTPNPIVLTHLAASAVLNSTRLHHAPNPSINHQYVLFVEEITLPIIVDV
jgi:hypothetical protein